MLIYKVENKVNGKIYIGQTARNFKERKAHHLRDALNDSNLPFHRAIRKYGEGNFTWGIVDECSTVEELNKREEYWIRELNTISPHGYNLRLGGKNGGLYCDEMKKGLSEARKGKNNSFYGKTHNEEVRKRIGEATRKRLKNKENHHFYGKECSEERRKKISKANKNNPKNIGMKGKTHSEEAKAKMSKAKKGKELSEEHKKKLSEVRKGQKFSEEHRRNMGLVRLGEKNPRAKLKKEDIIKIRELYIQGLTLQAIADLKSITFQNVHRIVTYKSWKHVV